MTQANYCPIMKGGKFWYVNAMKLTDPMSNDDIEGRQTMSKHVPTATNGMVDGKGKWMILCVFNWITVLFIIIG